MTKQLAPIELLAREYINAMGYAIMDNSELEELRQAIIKDFVSTLEPVGEIHNKDQLYAYLIDTDNEYSHKTKLYVLSEWSK